MLAAARAREADGDAASALTAYRAAVAGLPGSARARLGLARLLACDAVAEAELCESEALLREAVRLSAASSKAAERRVGAEAQSALALLLAQAGRDAEAGKLMGRRYRLGRRVLCYTFGEGGEDGRLSAAQLAALPCAALDRALPPSVLSHLDVCFAPAAPFWREHAYHAPDTGYFSYSHSLAGAPVTAWEALLRSLRALVAARLQPAAAAATHVEWWAHCRPHGCGHQLHYDSDAEGAPGADGAPRHPLASCVVFLGDGGGDDVAAPVGGPTLVTLQRRGDSSLAPDAFLLAPARNRLLAFDGSRLHGVVPGRGVSPQPGGRRVTLMVAFWDGIEVRPAEAPGASRPFPQPASGWAAALAGGAPRPEWGETALLAHAAAEGRPCCSLRRVERLWEDVDAGHNAAEGCALDSLVGLPHYDDAFQGF